MPVSSPLYSSLPAAISHAERDPVCPAASAPQSLGDSLLRYSLFSKKIAVGYCDPRLRSRDSMREEYEEFLSLSRSFSPLLLLALIRSTYVSLAFHSSSTTSRSGNRGRELCAMLHQHCRVAAQPPFACFHAFMNVIALFDSIWCWLKCDMARERYASSIKN